MSRYMEEEIVDGDAGGANGGSTSSSDQVHYLHNGTVRRKLIVLKPESTFTSDPDRRNHLNNNHHHHHHHTDVIGGLSHSDKRVIYSPSDQGSHHTRMSLFDSRLMATGHSWFSLKNCTRKLCLCLVISVVSVVFGAAVGVYFGFRILDAETIKVKEFRGAFRVVSGDNYTQDLMDTYSGAFLSRSQLYRAKLDTMFVSSVLKKAYLGSEILAIDPGESEVGGDVIVRFNIRMDPSKIDVDAGDVYLVLINEVLKGQSRLLSGIQVDEDSIEVHERKSKFVQDRGTRLSTVPLGKNQVNKMSKLVTFMQNDEDEDDLSPTTTETTFLISDHNNTNASKVVGGGGMHEDQISSPTKTTATETLGYDFGSRLLEAILSGNNAAPIVNSPENLESSQTPNDNSNFPRSNSRKYDSFREVTQRPNEPNSYVATLPKMTVSERTEMSESDKREISVIPRVAPLEAPAQQSSVNVVIHEHDNFPAPKVNSQPKGWLLNDDPVVTTTSRTTRTTVLTRAVSLPPRILSITELRSRSNLRTSELTTPQRRTTKTLYNENAESEAETRHEAHRTRPSWRTSTQPPTTTRSIPPTNVTTSKSTIARNRRPGLAENVRVNWVNTSTVRPMVDGGSSESNDGTKLTTMQTERLSTQPPPLDKTSAPNAEAIASILLPFLPLLSPDRACVPPDLNLCAALNRNLTAIPSISAVLTHTGTNIEPAFDFIRGVLESGCFEYAHYFVCQLLQPGCDKGKPILPCKTFCENFLENCRFHLPQDLYRSLSCNILPTAEEAKCVGTPECIHDLRSRGQNYLVCDGVVDCHDMSDETRCGWCSPGQFLCGGRKCVDKRLRCDGKPDCPNEADERNCIALANNGPEAKHAHPYMSEGFVFLNDKGSMGKICADTLLKSIPKDRRDIILKNVGESACELLNYRTVKSVSTKDDVDDIGPYFHILNPLSWRVTFLEAPCKSKQVIHVGCSNFVCGKRPSRTPEHMVHFLDSTKHVALVDHGDWPWHAALYTSNSHACDATLVAEQWLLTSSSCFQGLPGRHWTARIGIVRMESSAPFQQHRRIIGRMHSPVKGSDIALVKLDRPVQLTDFVRPACLPTSDNRFPTGKRCITLGWDLPRSQLRQVVVVVTETEECLWRWPVGKLHVFCTAEPAGLLNDCQGEDQSGGPLLCEDNGTWYLAGVVNWRIGCGLAKQPRLYDSVSVNANWIMTTIKNHQRASATNNDIVDM